MTQEELDELRARKPQRMKDDGIEQVVLDPEEFAALFAHIDELTRRCESLEADRDMMDES